MAPLLRKPDGTRSARGTTSVLELPGARLVYEVTGDGPTVVLVHGYGLDMRMWDRQVDPLTVKGHAFHDRENERGEFIAPGVQLLRDMIDRRPIGALDASP